MRWLVVLSLVGSLAVGLVPPVGAQTRAPDPVYGLLQLQPAPGCDRSCVATLSARLRAVAADSRCAAPCQADVRRGRDFLRTYRPAPNRHVQDVKARLRGQRRGILPGFVPASQYYDELNSCDLSCLQILNAERQQAAVAALQFNVCLCDSPEARSAYRGYLEASYVVGHDEAMRLMSGVASRIAGMTDEQMRAEAAKLGRLNPLNVAECVAYLALLLDARFFGLTVGNEVLSLFIEPPERD